MPSTPADIDWRWRRMFNIVAVGFLGDDITAKRHAVRLFRRRLEADRKYGIGEANGTSEEEAGLPPAG